MARRPRPPFFALAVFVLFSSGAVPPTAAATTLEEVEAAYADFNDAYGALGLIDSGFVSTYEDRTRAQWARILAEKRAFVATGLAELELSPLDALDARAVRIMRESLAAAEGAEAAPAAKCADAQRKDLALRALQQALYACFEELGNRIEFEGRTLSRVEALDLLARIDEPARRQALFAAFLPLWSAVNGDGRPDSPYRRMIAAARADARANGSPIDAAARTVGIATGDLERWLERILEAWRAANPGVRVEPWDYRYVAGAADRALAAAAPLERLQSINAQYYRDLGADLAAWGVVYDLAPRPGKAPLAYADYVRRGRMVNGAWRPTVVRVSANHAHGGLAPLNELVHENGHAAHMMALATRPAFMDLGDAVFFEAFADVPAWSVYERDWQVKYLGRSAPQRDSLRALYSNVALDVAWALFEMRMLRDAGDPNLVWTEITSRYLGVSPHPELAWWAVRVQLVDSPGYMVNYGLGAVITAQVRRRIREQLGPFDAGDPRWWGWLSQRLLRSGAERETALLLRDFLGGPVSIEPLLEELSRLQDTGEAVRNTGSGQE